MTIRLANGVYVADTARVLGDVRIGAGSSIWYGATIRGDVAPIRVGRGTNIQENSVIHCDHEEANVIGDDVTIGHGATVHGVLVDDGSLVGMGAILLSRSQVGKRCLIAAGSVVAPGTVVPDESVVMGIPGKVVRKVAARELTSLARTAETYRELSQRHYENPDDPTVRAWDTAAHGMSDT